MTYYKVIAGGEAVDAGHVWLRWDTRHGCMLACEMADAHYAQNYNESAIYRIGWLNPPPEGAPVYPVCEAAVIDVVEYDELVAALDDGETVPEPEPAPEPTPEPIPGPTPEPERPMTVKEMREKILELTSMAAKEDYPQGACFVLHDGVYRATEPISRGTTIRVGYNCEKITLEEVNA